MFNMSQRRKVPQMIQVHRKTPFSDKYLSLIHIYRKFSFRNLLESQCSKVQVIVTFLSILELMKMGHIHVEQDLSLIHI